ncbi:MAG: hypothetical protein ETSY1_07360 [Candidatus Entotheonella factor]|uniref:Right handed beta helix domain-containing protein n=1 Tax=Entotheonella factor TaxID=1429438 RepID=W4LVN1_ENTF1|nr:MAG: hypothetical protein ETSY1_07360 [Candidatus Entotheonella factor]
MQKISTSQPLIIFVTIMAIITLSGLKQPIEAQEAPKPPIFKDGGGQGKSYFVDPNGRARNCTQQSPCALNEGIKQAKAGDSVVLLDGTYKQNLETRRDGADGKHIVIRAQNKGKAKIIDNVGNLIHIKHSYITIRGLYAHDKSASVKGTSTIRISIKGGQHHIIIEDCTIFRSGNSGFVVTGKDKINRHIIFRNNFIDGTGYNTNPRHAGNLPSEAMYIGKAGGFGNAPGVENIMIYNNKIRDFSSNGLDIKATVKKAWIYNNEFYDQVPYEAHGLKTHSRDGTVLIQGGEIYFYNNKIHNCDPHSQVFKIRKSTTSKPNLVYNNVIYNIKNNRRAILFFSGNRGATSQVYNNTFYRLKNSNVDASNRELVIKNNIGINGVGDNLSTSDAKASYFKAPSNGDFSLTSSATKAINKARSKPVASKDATGRQIVGNNRDYGAFEYSKNGNEENKRPLPPTIQSIEMRP